MLLIPLRLNLKDSAGYMRSKRISQKSRAVLKAIAKGRSCDQILAADETLTSHDVFRALSESPTNFWHKKPSSQNPPRTKLS